MFRQISRNARLIRCVLAQQQLPAITVPASRMLSSKPPQNVNTGIIKDQNKAIPKESIKSAVNGQIYDRLVRNNKIVVFIKGTPQSPRCGFSNAVVQIFRMHGVEYESHDVLADNELREGIKAYTDWPTIPQVFIDGEFVGGCDILLEMHQNGELVETLKKAGIESELLKIQQEADKKFEGKDSKSQRKSKKD